MDPNSSLLDALDNNDDTGGNDEHAAATGAQAGDAAGGSPGAPDAGASTAADGAADQGDGSQGSNADGDGATARAAPPAVGEADAATGAAARGVVPHAALAEERERVRALRTELNDVKARLPTAEEMQSFRAWQKQQQEAAAKANQPPPPPAFTEDPEGHIAAREKAVVSKLEEVQKVATEAVTKVTEAQQQQQQREQAQQIARSITEAEAQFKATAPDYADALRHIRQVRIDTIKEMNPEATDEQIVQTILTEEARTAAQVMAQGRNPAEYAYNLAKRFGYRPAAPAANPAAAEAAKVFKDDTAATRDAARTMGSGGAADDTADLEEGPSTPELFEAVGERFGRRR